MIDRTTVRHLPPTHEHTHTHTHTVTAYKQAFNSKNVGHWEANATHKNKQWHPQESNNSWMTKDPSSYLHRITTRQPPNQPTTAHDAAWFISSTKYYSQRGVWATFFFYAKWQRLRLRHWHWHWNNCGAIQSTTARWCSSVSYWKHIGT